MRIFQVTILSLIFLSQSYAQDLICGNTKIEVTKVGEWESTRFIVSANNGSEESKLVLSSVDYVTSSCEANERKQSKILILATCGGSGCSESTYLVLDARTLKIELVPFQGQGNLDLVEKILGRKLNQVEI